MWAYLTDEQVLLRLGFITMEDNPAAGERGAIPLNPSAIGTWLFSTFKPRLDAYLAAFTAWLDPAKRSPEVILALKVTEKDVKEAMRTLYIYIKGHPLTTPKDKLEMGFPVQDDTVNTPAQTPSTWPVATVSVGGVGVLVFHYVDSQSEKRGKPKGVHGALLRWILSETMPAHWDELVNKTFATAQPITLTFDVSMQGKSLYYAMCWENTQGKQGPYSAIAKVIIG